MNKFLQIALAIAVMAITFTGLNAQKPFTLKPVATHYTDVFNQGSAEIVAYDPASKKLFFSNALANTIGVLDISNPLSPKSVDTIALSAYGGIVNSVAVFNGLVAVAVQAKVRRHREASDSRAGGTHAHAQCNGSPAATRFSFASARAIERVAEREREAKGRAYYLA